MPTLFTTEGANGAKKVQLELTRTLRRFIIRVVPRKIPLMPINFHTSVDDPRGFSPNESTPCHYRKKMLLIFQIADNIILGLSRGACSLILDIDGSRKFPGFRRSAVSRVCPAEKSRDKHHLSGIENVKTNSCARLDEAAFRCIAFNRVRFAPASLPASLPRTIDKTQDQGAQPAMDIAIFRSLY